MFASQTIGSGARAGRTAIWRRHCLYVFLSAALLLMAPWASASTVTILITRLGAGYDELIDPLREELLRTPGLKVQTIATGEGELPVNLRLADDTVLVVTIGLHTARQSLTLPDPRIPVLSVLVPRSSFETIATAVKNGRKYSALYIDQPPTRQMDLLRIVLPSARSVGMVVGPATQQDVPVYRTLATNRGLTLIAERADRETELYPVLQSVLRSSDVLVALPDSSIVNVTTAQNLLLTSFRFRVPVLGYSASYVRAGALAAVYSTPRHIGQEAAQIVRNFVRGGSLPAAKFPRYFNVAVNRQMADSLGLTIAEEAALLQRLLQLEGSE